SFGNINNSSIQYCSIFSLKQAYTTNFRRKGECNILSNNFFDNLARAYLMFFIYRRKYRSDSNRVNLIFQFRCNFLQIYFIQLSNQISIEFVPTSDLINIVTNNSL